MVFVSIKSDPRRCRDIPFQPFYLTMDDEGMPTLCYRPQQAEISRAQSGLKAISRLALKVFNDFGLNSMKGKDFKAKFKEYLKAEGIAYTDGTLDRKCTDLVNAGVLAKSGRNKYCLPGTNIDQQLEICTPAK